MNSAIHIDGSQGEGGGQIIRSSLALALVTGRAIQIDNIRAGRKKPGLLRQHLTGAQAAAEVCGGVLRGAALGSRSLSFEPRAVQPGNYHFRVSTAGSATLVLQTVLPALLIADGPSNLILEGGTHNAWAPPFDFLERAYLPLVNRMGPHVSACLERHGFHPAGGGRFTVHVTPSPQLSGFDLLERGKPGLQSMRALVANLPLHIAEREMKTVLTRLTWHRRQGKVEEVEAHGPGNAVLIELESEYVTEVVTAFGSLGVKAEQVASEAAWEAQAYLASEATVGPHLADQLMLPLGISAWQDAAVRGGSFRTFPLTPHSTTHLDILQKFLEIDVCVEETGNGETIVRLLGRE